MNFIIIASVLLTILLPLTSSYVPGNKQGVGGPLYLTVEVTPCTAADFDDGDGCTMTCSISFDPSSDPSLYNLKSWAWKYYKESTEMDDPKVIIFDGFSGNIYANGYAINLEMNTYNGGSYVCFFDIYYDTSEATFYGAPVKIDSGSGINLNMSCTDSTSCLALNSVCADDGTGSNVCQCPDDHSIQFSATADTPACLAPEPINGNCNIDDECAKANQDIICASNVCVCRGDIILAAETNQTMCLDPIPLTDPCVYDEQCFLNTAYSVCSSGTCGCAKGYKIDTSSGDKSTYICTPSGPLDFTLEVTPCTAADITNADGCTMTCSAKYVAEDTSLYKLNSCSWDYYSDASRTTNPSVIIFDGFSETTDASGYTCSLFLNSYNSGQYVCFFDISYDTDAATFNSGPIIIGSGEELDINVPCTDSVSCLALNSVCVDDGSGSNNVCQCPPDHNIPYDEAPDTLACLAPEPIGANCNIDDECVQTNQDIGCDANVCTCLGTMMYVTETEQEMCLDPKYLMESCVYNEQCLLAASNSYCNNNDVCDCDSGYTMNMDSYPDASKYYCEPNSNPFDLSVEVEACTASDFTDGDGCVMTCTVKLDDVPDPSLYQLIDWNWTYGKDSSSATVFIYDEVTHETSPTEYSTSVTMDTYNSGQYVCHFSITYDNQTQTLSSDPIIINSDTTPVYLNQQCVFSTQCLALNSICAEDGSDSRRVCQCPIGHSIPYSNQSDTPACLAHVPLYGTCQVDAECALEDEDVICLCNECICGGAWMNVSGEFTCLKTAYLTESCVSDGQCIFNDMHSHCQYGSCQCNRGWTLQSTGSDVSSWYCAEECGSTLNVNKNKKIIS